MIQVYVENAHGIIEGLEYEDARAFGDRLNTEVEYQGNRIKFVPSRYALDVIFASYGKTVFHAGCKFAWSHFYKKQAQKDVDFNWVTRPYDHQREWWHTIKDMEYFALEWEMGLGKSKTILDIMQWAYSKKDLDALLVVTLPGVHRKWIDVECPTHLPKDMWHGAYWNTGRVDAGMWYGPNARNRKDITKSDRFAVATINFESVHRAKGLKFCERFLRNRNAAIVVDESQHMKTPGAAVTKALLKLGKIADRRYITSGSVSGGSTLDPYTQYNFLSPSIVENMPFHAWKKRFAIEEEVPGKTFMRWTTDPVTKKSRQVEEPVRAVTGFKNEEQLRRMLDPYRSRLLKEDCLDLPDKIYRLRSFEMTAAQHKAYMQMTTEFVSEMDGGKTMTASMAMVKLIRLQQIACGFYTPDDSDPNSDDRGINIDEKNPRVIALLQEIEKVNGQSIIWSSWRHSLREIKAALRLGYDDTSISEYHGGIASDDHKAANLLRFQEEKTKFFLSNPQSGGTGIDLVTSQHMFYFNNSYDYIMRKQSEDRFHRIGQEGASCVITDFEALGTIDRVILKALKSKDEVASSIAGDTLKAWLTSNI